MKSLNLLNKFKNFKKVDKIYRVRKELSRYGKIRLDKDMCKLISNGINRDKIITQDILVLLSL